MKLTEQRRSVNSDVKCKVLFSIIVRFGVKSKKLWHLICICWKSVAIRYKRGVKVVPKKSVVLCFNLTGRTAQSGQDLKCLACSNVALFFAVVVLLKGLSVFIWLLGHHYILFIYLFILLADSAVEHKTSHSKNVIEEGVKPRTVSPLISPTFSSVTVKHKNLIWLTKVILFFFSCWYKYRYGSVYCELRFESCYFKFPLESLVTFSDSA